VTASAGRRLVSVVREHGALAVFLIATAWAVVVTWPVAIHFGDTIYGTPGDATGTVTDYWWWGYALTHGKPILDNTLQGVPLGSEWDLLPFSPLPVFIFAPLDVAIGPIATYNVLILSSFPLTAWATYLLARTLGISRLGSAFAGLALAFIPYHIEKATGHGNQAHLELLAGTLLFLVRWRQGGSRWNLVGAGALAGLQAWWEPSVFYVMAFAVPTFLVVSAVLPDKGVRRMDWIRRHVLAGLVMVAALVPFLPVAFLFFHRPGSATSLATQLSHAQTSGEAIIYSARLREYFEPWYANPLVPNSIKQWEFLHLHGSNFVENSLGLGYTVLALAFAATVWARRWFVIALCIALIFVGVLVALPPDQKLGPIAVHPPTYYLTQVVTIFRVYARFAMMVQLGVCLLAGMGIAVLQARLGAGRRQLLLVIPFLLMAVEFNNLPPNHVTQILPAPAEYVWLRDQPQGIVMEYPAKAGGETGQQEIQIRQDLLYQMIHLHPSFLTEVTNGQVGAAAKRLEPYYGPGVVDQLKSYGVRYVLVHRTDYFADGYDVPLSVPGLTYVTTLGDTDIFTVS
jgi:6-pyruvoyl-tetrahydropterin synthase related domain